MYVFLLLPSGLSGSLLVFLVNSFVEAVFSIFSFFGCVLASVDVV